MSRSQAKRLMQRTERLQSVARDFDGVDDIGQAFADEVFRVCAPSHRHLKPDAVNMIAAVERMVRHVQAGSAPRASA
jgi:hypothetical protein